MTRQELLQLLDEKGIPYEMTEHIPVFTVDEMLKANIPHSELIAKNLFLRDDKKRNYYLVTVKENRPVDLRAFQEQFVLFPDPGRNRAVGLRGIRISAGAQGQGDRPRRPFNGERKPFNKEGGAK